jgi:predicted permease
MTPQRFRRPLLIAAAVVAALSLVAVGAVMALAFNNTVAPPWVTSTALYGLPVAFLLMAALVGDAVAARRRTRDPGER